MLFLGFPKFDPHGDPIPDVNGKMTTKKQINLIDLPLLQKAEISAVASQNSELLELLKHKKIAIGTKITVVQNMYCVNVSIRDQEFQSLHDQYMTRNFSAYSRSTGFVSYSLTLRAIYSTSSSPLSKTNVFSRHNNKTRQESGFIIVPRRGLEPP